MLVEVIPKASQLQRLPTQEPQAAARFRELPSVLCLPVRLTLMHGERHVPERPFHGLLATLHVSRPVRSPGVAVSWLIRIA